MAATEKQRASTGSSSSTAEDAPSSDPPAGIGGEIIPTRFTLSGRSVTLDPRVHAWRRDLADIALADRLFAPHYARPIDRACGQLATFVRAEPSDSAPHISELLPGEPFRVLEYAGGWAWGQSALDGQVGYVEAVELVAPVRATHVVCEASAPIHAAGLLGAPELARLPMGARLAGREEGGCLLTEGGCVPTSHLRTLGEHEEDPVAVAQRLFGMPYLMGGRSFHGIDCSGLVQLAFALCGIALPRDSDQQRAAGEALSDGSPLRRGDLVFFPGHVGLMFDDRMLIHASRSQSKVTVEPLEVVEARSLKLTGRGMTDRRRIAL